MNTACSTFPYSIVLHVFFICLLRRIVLFLPQKLCCLLTAWPSADLSHPVVSLLRPLSLPHNTWLSVGSQAGSGFALSSLSLVTPSLLHLQQLKTMTSSSSNPGSGCVSVANSCPQFDFKFGFPPKEMWMYSSLGKFYLALNSVSPRWEGSRMISKHESTDNMAPPQKYNLIQGWTMSKSNQRYSHDAPPSPRLLRWHHFLLTIICLPYVCRTSRLFKKSLITP